MRLFKKAIIFLLLFVVHFSAFGVEKSDDKLIKIGVLAFRPAPQTYAQWKPTADYLSQIIHGHHFVVVPLNYHDLEEAVKKGEVDFVTTNPSHYVVLESLYGATRIATLIRKQKNKPLATLGGVVFLRSDRSDINSLKDLKGKKVAAVAEDALGGYQAGMSELLSAGVNKDDLAKLVFTEEPHDKVVMLVKNGQADAGMVRTGVLEGMEQDGKIKIADFKVLASKNDANFPFLLSTKLYPEWPFAKLKHTSNELSTQVVMALLDIPHNSEPTIKGGYFGWTVPLDYSPMHEVLRKLKLRPYDSISMSFEELLELIWPWLLAGGLVTLMLGLIVYVEHRSNKRLKEVQIKLAAVDKFRQHFIAQTDPFVMYDMLRDDLIELTQSKYGLIGEVDTDSDGVRFLTIYSLSNISWSKETQQLYAEFKEKGFKFKKLDNIFGRVVTHEETVISNNPSTDPRRAGLPFGHPPINSFLGIPVYYGDKLVGEIGLANRPGGYDEGIVAYLAPVVSALGQIIVARQEQEAREKAEAKLSEINSSLQVRVEEEVAKRQEHERILSRQSKMAAMGEMIGAIAHQWKQPLNALGLMIQDVQPAYEYNEIDEKYVQNLSKSGMGLIKHMSQTIEDFRNFFKPEKEKSAFDPVEIINNVLLLLSTQFRERNIDVNIATEEARYLILGYPNEMKQALLNIINNAKDAILINAISAGKIAIQVKQEGDDIIITVCDNAGGIPENMIDKIFDPYFTTKGEKGTGIGLSITKSIIEESMNGKISVQNSPDGACFKIKLASYLQ